MANGITNPMTYGLTRDANGVAAHTHSLDEVNSLRSELVEIRGMCGDALKTTLSAFMESYANTLHDGLVTREEFDTISTQLANIIAVVETWDPENEDSTLETLIKEVAELQIKVGTLPELLTTLATFNESNLTAAKAVENMATELAEFKTRIDELAASGSDTGDQLTDVDDRLINAESAIATLNSVVGLSTTEEVSGHSKQLTMLEQAVSKYLPSADKKGTLQEAIDTLNIQMPTALNIVKVADLIDEPEVLENPEASKESQAPIENETYLNYNLSFINSQTEEQFSTNLELTADIKTYLESAFDRFLAQYLNSRLIDADSRLTNLSGSLANLTQHVACLESHHNFLIKDLAMYFADGDNGIGMLPSVDSELLKVATTFPEAARIDTKTWAPDILRNRKFYVVFETSYPIDLTDGKVSLIFGDTEMATPGTETLALRCSRLGIPDISNAVYVLHATSDGDATELTPFQVGNSRHVFGQLFTQAGPYEFMLKTTDPYNPNVNAIKAKRITIGYPIYYGISEHAALTTELATQMDRTLLQTEFNSPATTIDWTAYNTNNAAVYYYYLVPSILLDNKTLQFNTGYGPGGWEALEEVVELAGVSYNLFRTTYQLTYCPNTVVTTINLL